MALIDALTKFQQANAALKRADHARKLARDELVEAVDREYGHIRDVIGRVVVCGTTAIQIESNEPGSYGVRLREIAQKEETHEHAG